MKFRRITSKINGRGIQQVNAAIDRGRGLHLYAERVWGSISHSRAAELRAAESEVHGK